MTRTGSLSHLPHPADRAAHADRATRGSSTHDQNLDRAARNAARSPRAASWVICSDTHGRAHRPRAPSGARVMLKDVLRERRHAMSSSWRLDEAGAARSSRPHRMHVRDVFDRTEERESACARCMPEHRHHHAYGKAHLRTFFRGTGRASSAPLIRDRTQGDELAFVRSPRTGAGKGWALDDGDFNDRSSAIARRRSSSRGTPTFRIAAPPLRPGSMGIMRSPPSTATSRAADPGASSTPSRSTLVIGAK